MINEKEFRIEMLKIMNHLVIEWGDESLWEVWISLGVPDCPTEDDFEWIAENDAEWLDVLALFSKLSRANYEVD